MLRFPRSMALVMLVLATAALAACGGGGGGLASELGTLPFVAAPTPAQWADDGCVICHGADGGGAGGGPSILCSSFDRLDAHVRSATTTHAGGAYPLLTDTDLLALVEFLRTADCPAGTPADPTPPPSNGIPASHTESEHGVLHHPDYETNRATCTTCHGADLEGTPSAPSCFSCHSHDGFDDVAGFDDDDDDEDDGDDDDDSDEDDDGDDGDDGDGGDGDDGDEGDDGGDSEDD